MIEIIEPVRSGKPVEITEPVLLLVEGDDEKEFFGALLREMKMTGIQVQDFRGKNNLSNFLETLRDQHGFAQRVVSLGIVRDADDSPEGAFQSVGTALRNNKFPQPSKPETPEGNNPRVAVLILPDAETSGMLETICLRSVADDPVMQCIGEYFNCIRKVSQLPGNMDKAMVQAFLASRPESVPHLGIAAQKDYWQWNNQAFDHVKGFLRVLQTDVQ